MTYRVRKGWFGSAVLQDNIDGQWVNTPYDAVPSTFELVTVPYLAALKHRIERADKRAKAQKDARSKKATPVPQP